MNKFEEIIKAWRIRWKPTEKEKLLADKRLAICKTCPSVKSLIEGSSFFMLCGECGCPLDGKTHSPVKGACPLGKWNDVENEIL